MCKLTGAELATTSRYGSPELVKSCAARGDRFEAFNSSFVKVSRRLPEPSPAEASDPLNRFIAEATAARPRYATPFLVGANHYDKAVAELGYDLIKHSARQAVAA